MKKIYIILIIGILLIGIVIAGSLLPKTDTIIKLNKTTECLTKFVIDNRTYTLHFKPSADIKASRDMAFKNNLEQDVFRSKIDAKKITEIEISSTICDGVETLGEGKITLETQK